MKFSSTVDLNGKAATGIVVPAEVVESFDAGKRVPVSVTINGYTYRSTVAVYGGKYMLPLSAANRSGAGVEAGDKVEIDLVHDTAPRTVEPPADFAAALAANPAAAESFAALAYTRQREYVESIEGAKQAATRTRRIDAAIAALTVK